MTYIKKGHPKERPWLRGKRGPQKRLPRKEYIKKGYPKEKPWQRGSKLRTEEQITEFIQKYIEIKKETNCHEWLGRKNAGGYGIISIFSRPIIVTRYLLGIHDSGHLIQACHTCDNPSCINKEHLYIGDAKTNNTDKVARGRYKGQKSWYK